MRSLFVYLFTGKCHNLLRNSVVCDLFVRVHVIAGNKIIIIFNGVWKGRILQFNNHDEDLIYLLSINAFLSR